MAYDIELYKTDNKRFRSQQQQILPNPLFVLSLGLSDIQVTRKEKEQLFFLFTERKLVSPLYNRDQTL